MSSPSKSRVLCVDDEAGVLRSLNALLRSRFDVTSACDGHEALALMRESEFDVVISDQRMPGMSGTEFLERVKTFSPRTMRLLLTGHAEFNDGLRLINDSEVFRFIHKPWDNGHLVELVTYAANVARHVRPGLPQQKDGACGAPTPAAHRFCSDADAVLLMDNDPATERLVRSVLGQDMLLLWARSPGEAVALMHRHKVAVIVADNHLGTGATLKLVQAAKRSSPNMVAVIHADASDGATLVRLVNEGQVFRFLPKPAHLAHVGQVIRAALEKHRQLMAQPTIIARHALDISGAGALAEARHGIAGCMHRPVSTTNARPPRALPAPRAQRFAGSLGPGWLHRIFRRV